MGVADWGITMAIHRLGVGIWTFFASQVIGLIVIAIATVVAIVHLILTAIPRIDGDMATMGIDFGGWVAELFSWVGANADYVVDGDNPWMLTPDIP